MPSLRELQQVFAGALLADDPALLAHVRPGRFGAARHVAIHRNNVFALLTEALGDVHPAVRRLVGDEFFGYAAAHYVRAHPPGSGNLHDFGGRFADFLAAFAPARELPYLPDVARLEWAWHEAFHAPEARPLALDALARVAPADYPQLRFGLHPSARLVASPYPVVHIWEVNRPGFDGEVSVSLDEGGQQALVIRRELEVEIEALAPAEFVLLSACASGAGFEAVADRVRGREPDFDLAAALRRFVADRTIVGFSLQPS